MAAAQYKEQDKGVKRKCCFDKNQYLLRKMVKAEDAWTRGDSKTLYRTMKELSGGSKP